MVARAFYVIRKLLGLLLFIPTPQPKLRGKLISEGTPQKASALDEVSHESSVRYAFCGARAR